jgi:hypothetical protein
MDILIIGKLLLLCLWAYASTSFKLIWIVCIYYLWSLWLLVFRSVKHPFAPCHTPLFLHFVLLSCSAVFFNQWLAFQFKLVLKFYVEFMWVRTRMHAYIHVCVCVCVCVCVTDTVLQVAASSVFCFLSDTICLYWRSLFPPCAKIFSRWVSQLRLLSMALCSHLACPSA